METQKALTTSPSPGGTIIFSTVGRSNYGFDVFSVSLRQLDFDPESEQRLTDGISVNYNGQFVDDDNQSLVFISERNGCPSIFHQTRSSSEPKLLLSAPNSLFHDRPILRRDDGQVYFVSAHEPSDSLYKSWSAVYSAPININNNMNSTTDKHTTTATSSLKVTRLTPNGVVDYSPAISQSGQLIAVASYGSKPWGGEFHELNTEIVVFPASDPSKRTVLAKRGGWPSWCGDATLYYHRESEDGWWSIYAVNVSQSGSSSERVTPPGVHAFTPAAFHDGKRIAVATRRKEREYRHIEIFDIETGEFHPVTELLNPKLHHYNPFVSPGSQFLGYHRFRLFISDSAAAQVDVESLIPNLEPVLSPIKSLKMIRINGNFPSFSPDGELIAFNPDFDANGNGGLKVMKSDGTKRWTLVKGRVAFYNSWGMGWDPSNSNNNKNKKKKVIFTSLGGIFQAAHAPVQIARVTFQLDALDSINNNNNNDDDVDDDVKIEILTKEDTGNNAFPACSPDGKSVVFRSGRSGHKNLYIMDAVEGEGGEETSLRQLTEGAWTDTMPSWSPDGHLIAFSSNRHDPTNAVTFGIYVIRPDGTGLRRVHVAEGSTPSSSISERINHVCFSPTNGEWLLFTANMGGVTAEPVSLPNQFQPYGDLFIVKLDGTGLRRLTWNGYENGTPTWGTGTPTGMLAADDIIDNGLRRLSLLSSVNNKNNCDPLTGQFQDPLWITTHF